MTLSRLVSTLCVGAATALAVPALAADPSPAGSGNPPGLDSDNFCIDIQNIRETRAINPKTILVRLQPGRDWAKISLVNSCSGLTTQGFAFETSINKLCRTNTLRVVEPVGATCMIDRIEPITEADAKALEAKKRG